MNEIQQNVNTADQTRALVEEARNKAVSDYLNSMNNPQQAPTFSGERPTFVASAKQSVHDWTDNSGIPFVAQINPYAAAGMGFANQMANPFKQRYFEERADANEAEDARRLNYELQKDKYDDDYMKFRDKLNDSRYDKEDLYSKYADALRGIDHDKDFEYRKSRDAVSDKHDDRRYLLDKDRQDLYKKERLELKAKEKMKDTQDIYDLADSIPLIDESLLPTVNQAIEPLVKQYNASVKSFKNSANNGSLTKESALKVCRELESLLKEIEKTDRENPRPRIRPNLENVRTKGLFSDKPVQVRHNGWFRSDSENIHQKNIREQLRAKQEELSARGMTNLTRKQANQIIAQDPLVAKAINNIYKQYNNPDIRFAVSHDDDQRLSVIIQNPRTGEIMDIKNLPEMLDPMFTDQLQNSRQKLERYSVDG